MDITISNQIAKLIQQITETGEWNLDPDDLKSIKSICKRSDANVDVAFDYWFVQLRKEHAQIRYSCVQLAEQLFQRSHRFRILLTDEFPLFISLTVGGRQRSLPPPQQVAAKLKEYTLALVTTWREKFANKFRPIAIAYDYLQHNGILVANQPTLDSLHSQNEDRANRQNRMQPVYERRLQQISNESEEYLSIIHENLQQMQGCFEILLPKYDDGSDIDFEALMKGDIESSKAMTQDQNNYKEELRSHGLGSSRYKLEIVISKNPVADEVHESKENEVVFEQLREGYKVARNKHNKQLTIWINSLGRMELQNNENRNILLKKLLDVKADIIDTIRKSELLGIQLPSKEGEASDDNDDEYLDELFEEIDVPSSSTRARLSRSKLPPAQRIFPLAFEPGMEDDVTYIRTRLFSETESIDEQGSSKDGNSSSKGKGKGKGKAIMTPDKEELLKKAPVVEWGEDLYYWDKSDAQFNTSGIERSHRFMGVGEGTNEIPDQLLEKLRKRTIYYKPQMPQNLKACRAPLRSGKLCPRRDLVTCPFHGKIIPRNEYGIPVNSNEEVDNNPSSSSLSSINPSASTAPSEQKQQETKDSNDLWQDIERDVMQQANQPLIELNKKKRKRNKPQSNLIDVRKKKETSYTRLQKKLDAPQTRQNVEDAQDYERTMKSRDQQMNMW
ncbi:hypothetical protein BDA99DRAFT_516598 [Phascolomyces articulosus]|uniref:UV-stimulated scaffold protein A C-terminal domain-containing protein n=1 Tax=Phascolomyces articulosus TaxID=60185 RepID=A0AAD5JVF7_9FUNG|nr:hypothetical protein BDA99DRAFT_516598 [Phascolomyces articulosus]